MLAVMGTTLPLHFFRVCSRGAMCVVLLCQTHHTIEQKVRKSTAVHNAVVAFFFVCAVGVRCARYCCAKRTIQSNRSTKIDCLLYKYN